MRYGIVTVLEEIVNMLGNGAKQLWLGTVVVGWWDRQAGIELATRKAYPPRALHCSNRLILPPFPVLQMAHI